MRTAFVILLAVVVTSAGVIMAERSFAAKTRKGNSAQQPEQKDSKMNAQPTTSKTDVTGTGHPGKAEEMKNSQDYGVTFLVDNTPEEVFDAINNVRGWWSEEIEGRTDELGEFTYHNQDLHRCTMQITELVPGKKVVWHVVDNYFNFVKDTSEWAGNDIVFDIVRKGDKTEVRFTQRGLVPAYECYDVCSDAWGTYIKGSLRDLITTGKGQPNLKGGRFQDPHHEEIVNKTRQGKHSEGEGQK